MSGTLTVPADPRTLAFRHFVALLRRGGDLRVVKTWRAWDGTAGDDDPPSTGQLPWARLSPRADRSGWHSTATHESGLLITIETAIAGTDVGQSFNLWQAFEQALFPQDPAKREAWREALAAVGVSSIEVLQPAAGVADPAAAGNGMIVARGEVRLRTYIRT